MKKLLIGALFALCMCGRAEAGNPTFEIGYGSHTLQGIVCTTGTVVQINGSRPSGIRGRVAGYLLQNYNSDAIFVGDANVSTHTGTIANLGAKLTQNDSLPLHLGRDQARDAIAPIYCIAANAATVDAGTSGAELMVWWFFY